MRHLSFIACLLTLTGLAACSTPEKDAAPDRTFLCLNEANGVMHDHPHVFAPDEDRALPALHLRLLSLRPARRRQVDAVVDCNLQPHDYLPVVEAAGGVITDWQGKELTMQSDGRVVAAGSAEIHAALLKVVAG